MTDPDRRCGTCKWFVPEPKDHGAEQRGECSGPIPSCVWGVQHNRIFHGSPLPLLALPRRCGGEGGVMREMIAIGITAVIVGAILMTTSYLMWQSLPYSGVRAIGQMGVLIILMTLIVGIWAVIFIGVKKLIDKVRE